MRAVAVARWFGIAAHDWSEVPRQCRMSARQVSRIIVAKRADDADLVHLPGQAAKMLADLNARDISRDRLELAADIARCFGLRIEGIKLTRPTPHEEKDAAFRPAKGSAYERCCWRSRQRLSCHTHAQQTQSAELQQPATRHRLRMVKTQATGGGISLHASHSILGRRGRRSRRDDWIW